MLCRSTTSNWASQGKRAGWAVPVSVDPAGKMTFRRREKYGKEGAARSGEGPCAERASRLWYGFCTFGQGVMGVPPSWRSPKGLEPARSGGRIIFQKPKDRLRLSS